MNNFTWTKDNLATLKTPFLYAVIGNMRDRLGATIKLGEMGDGHRPNYELSLPNGRELPYNGATHSIFRTPGDTDVIPFNPEHLSQAFTLEDIWHAIETRRLSLDHTVTGNR
jgi:hypothetical protein